MREEGVEVVLINSNPATIMTDKQIADKVYIEPLTVETIKKVIIKEKPDSILPTLGGQNALNLAVELEESGFLKEHNVTMIGTSADTIRMAEDRELFKEAMERIHQPCAESEIAEDLDRCLARWRSASATRWWFARRIPSAAAAAASHMTDEQLHLHRVLGPAPQPCASGSDRALHLRLERD